MKNPDARSIIVPVLISLLTLGGACALGQPQFSICDDNPYALCSHALCECLGQDGNPGPCEYHFKDKENNRGSRGDIGWSRCTCPVVATGNTGADAAYNANFANASLDCSERRQPTTAGTQFPTYVQQKIPNVYSTYSFGDSLPGKLYRTMADGKLLDCGEPMMALCLDMPCTTDADGKTVCYCQNVALASCSSTGSWNTLSPDCAKSRCREGQNDSRVWSGACVADTEGAIAQLNQHFGYQVPSPEYCGD